MAGLSFGSLNVYVCLLETMFFCFKFSLFIAPGCYTQHHTDSCKYRGSCVLVISSSGVTRKGRSYRGSQCKSNTTKLLWPEPANRHLSHWHVSANQRMQHWKLETDWTKWSEQIWGKRKIDGRINEKWKRERKSGAENHKVKWSQEESPALWWEQRPNSTLHLDKAYNENSRPIGISNHKEHTAKFNRKKKWNKNIKGMFPLSQKCIVFVDCA